MAESETETQTGEGENEDAERAQPVVPEGEPDEIGFPLMINVPSIICSVSPGRPRQSGCESGNTPLAMSVVTTGICSASATERITWCTALP